MFVNEKNLKVYSYVCPLCFDTIEKCTCDVYPWYLIQIDKMMLPIIKELNKKCFYTEMCCEGHIGSNEFIYVQFKRKYKIKKELPKDFVGDGSYLKAPITGRTLEGKNRNKRKLLKSLYEWVIELEPRGTNILMR